MFEIMETAEHVYKVETTSKTIIRADAIRGINVRKRKEGESISPTKPKKG